MLEVAHRKVPQQSAIWSRVGGERNGDSTKYNGDLAQRSTRGE